MLCTVKGFPNGDMVWTEVRRAGGHVRRVQRGTMDVSRRRALVASANVSWFMRVSLAGGNWGTTRRELDCVGIGVDRVATRVGEEKV